MRGYATKWRIIVASLILVSILLISLYSAYWTNALTEDLVARLETAQALAEDENWEKAIEITDAVKEDWHSNHFAIHVIARHTEADQILINFLSVQAYLKWEESEQYLAANAQLIARLELLAEMEAPSWENVL